MNDKEFRDALAAGEACKIAGHKWEAHNKGKIPYERICGFCGAVQTWVTEGWLDETTFERVFMVKKSEFCTGDVPTYHCVRNDEQ